MGHSIQIKKAVLQKVLSGNKTHDEISKEFGIGRSTIGKWLREYRKGGNINLKSKEKRPRDWTPEERVSALMASGSMSSEESASWCRKNGIFLHHLKQWRQDAVSGMATDFKKQTSVIETQLRRENSALKKDLSRKEKALAETAALLVLKKKAQVIWGEPEED
nr:helix-turn-helix domain-containing protein [Desulfobacter vibrioformis]